MKSAIIFAMLSLAAIGTTRTAFGEEQSPDVDQLIAQWTEQNSLCRGLHGDDPRMQPACDERQQLGRALDAHDWCYGKENQYGYQMEWHRCETGSVHYE